MIENLAEALAPLQAISMAGLVIFARVGALVSMVPGFGEQIVPVRVKLGLAFAFSLIVGPAVSQGQTSNLVPTVLISEVLVGLFFGIFLRFFVHVLQIAGSIAAQATSLSQIFGGMAGVDPQPAIGRVLLIAGLALAALMGLHVQIAHYILAGYEMVPVGSIVSAEIAVNLGVHRIAHSFSLGFTLAAPFVIASLIYNVTLGFVNKAMPQLMVSFVGAPAITAAGLLFLLLCSPLILSLWHDALTSFFEVPFGGVR